MGNKKKERVSCFLMGRVGSDPIAMLVGVSNPNDITISTVEPDYWCGA